MVSELHPPKMYSVELLSDQSFVFCRFSASMRCKIYGRDGDAYLVNKHQRLFSYDSSTADIWQFLRANLKIEMCAGTTNWIYTPYSSYRKLLERCSKIRDTKRQKQNLLAVVVRWMIHCIANLVVFKLIVDYYYWDYYCWIEQVVTDIWRNCVNKSNCLKEN